MSTTILIAFAAGLIGGLLVSFFEREDIYKKLKHVHRADIIAIESRIKSLYELAEDRALRLEKLWKEFEFLKAEVHGVRLKAAEGRLPTEIKVTVIEAPKQAPKKRTPLLDRAGVKA